MFRPVADAPIPLHDGPPPPDYAETLGPVFDSDNIDNPVLPWTASADENYYPRPQEPHKAAPIPDRVSSLATRYLRPTLARNERLRLCSLWYYTRDIFKETEFLSGLQDKVSIAQTLSGWDTAAIGMLDVNFLSQLALIDGSPGILPRGETLCSHTVNQPPGTVFLLPNIENDWRFSESPHVEFGGVRAYAGTPLRLQDNAGHAVCLGSLCVTSSEPQSPLTKAQQTTLVCLADWVVSDIVRIARARRSRDKARMMDALAAAKAASDHVTSEESVIEVLQAHYPAAVITLQPASAVGIEIHGRDPISPTDLSDCMWEDIDYIDEFLAKSNHLEPPTDRVIRIVASSCERGSGGSFLTVGTKDFRLIFDDLDVWFVQSCADIISQTWHKHLLQEAISSRERFLRGFTHQLRTPLHGILGSVELLAEELSGVALRSNAATTFDQLSSPDIFQETKNHLQTIKKSGRDLVQIVNSMITLNKWAEIAHADRQHATCTALEFERSLASEIGRMLADDSRYKVSIIFNHSLPPERYDLQTDLSLLRDTLLPLIFNAIQATPDGLVVISVSIFPSSNKLVVDIRDTGQGIPLNDQQRVFELYERLDSHATGAGLGLTLATRFAALLGGSVELVSSKAGRGSHFRATFQGLRATCKSSSLLTTETLFPGLTNIPNRFHVLSPSSTALTLREEFAKFLSCHGLIRSNEADGCLIVTDCLNRSDQDQPNLNQLSQHQVIICLVHDADNGIFWGSAVQNVVCVRGPFATSTFSSALERADQVLKNMKASKTNFVHSFEDRNAPSQRNEVVPDIGFRDEDAGLRSCHTSGIGNGQKAVQSLTTRAEGCAAQPHSSHDVSARLGSTVHNRNGSAEKAGTYRTVSHPMQVVLNEECVPRELGTTNHANLGSMSSSVDSSGNFSGSPSSLRNSTHNVLHCTVLIVDDNVINLKLMQMYCLKRGLLSISARDGQEAVHLFRAQQTSAVSEQSKPPIQLILMDLQMPVCDGVDATKQVRQMEREHGWPSSVIFVVTGQDSVLDRAAAAEAGGQEYYVKPVSMATLDAGLAAYFPGFSGYSQV